MKLILSTTIVLSCTVFLVTDAFGPRIVTKPEKPQEMFYAKNGEFPYMVQVQPLGCGGTIIGHKWVLTAEHCVSKPKSYYIRYGSVDREKGLAIAVAKIFKKEKNWFYDDIAILELASSIPDSHYFPIKLPRHNENVPLLAGILLGWGNIIPSVEKLVRSPVLKKLNVSLLESQECLRQYPQVKDVTNSNINNTICAYGEDKQEGACMGDSGGPLVINGTQYGIAHAVMNPYCIDAPSVYTLTSVYRNWIDAILNSDLKESLELYRT